MKGQVELEKRLAAIRKKNARRAAKEQQSELAAAAIAHEQRQDEARERRQAAKTSQPAPKPAAPKPAPAVQDVDVDALLKLKLLQDVIRTDECASDLRVFVRDAWKVLHPTEQLIEAPYIDAICEYLMSMRRGDFSRLIVNQPPRTLKSTIISVIFPAWVWATDPTIKFIFWSYSFEKLTVPLSVDRRTLIQSPWYQESWGSKFKLSADENQKWAFSNDKSGHMVCLSGATGIGGNFLIVDDPHSVEEAISDVDRERGVRMVRQGLMSRLDNPQKDSVILVMQRLHHKDVAGSFIEDGTWTHLKLPAEEQKGASIPLPISSKVWERPAGDLLDPVRLSKQVLQQKQLELGASGYAGQYLQEPSVDGGNIFKSDWFQFYDPEHVPQFEQVMLSVDATFGNTKNADDCAIHAWGIVGNRSYLIERDTRKMNFATTKAAVRAMYQKHNAHGVLIEKKANGQALIDELKQEFFCIPISPDWGDKQARAQACSPMVEAGTVYLPSNLDGTTLQSLAAKFPNADKDDIDAMTQFLNWRRAANGWGMFLETQARMANAKPRDSQISPTGVYQGKKPNVSASGVYQGDAQPLVKGLTWAKENLTN